MPLASQMLEFLKDPISVKVVLSNFGDIKRMLLNLKLVSICDFGKISWLKYYEKASCYWQKNFPADAD